MSDLNSLVILPLPFLAVYLLYIVPLKHIGKWRHYRRYGYLDAPYNPPTKAFGSQRYAVRRAEDQNRLSGMVISKNPFYYSRKRKLEDRRDAQDGMTCEVCGRAVENTVLSHDGPAFREEWQAFHVLFFPVTRKHLDTEAFCHRHVPRDWKNV